ncbi:MAG TPA: hypothetical protein VHK26_05465 [Methyloceanibacter sp.]|nr:hypothetical protein [Methyloceanibacter sp.]
MNTLAISTFTRSAALALVLVAGATLAADPGAAASRKYVYVNKGAPTYGDFRTPAGPRRIIIRDRLEGPRWAISDRITIRGSDPAITPTGPASASRNRSRSLA